MIRTSLRRLLLYPTEIHLLCAAVALLSCIPLLFPAAYPDYLHETATAYAGIALSVSVLVSFAFMLLSGFVLMLKLHNTKALVQGLKWLSVWGATCLIFAIIAVLADVEAPNDANATTAIQTSDTLYPARDLLNGPASLFISIMPEEQPADTVVLTPNLSKLENEHADVLKAYLETSPRWGGKDDNDTFYSRPGHLVMVPPVTSGAPGLVHVCFRRLTGGALLPKGYTVVKPGEPFPEEQDASTDLAVDLGGNQFLLLAWRGTRHEETMHKALNAAISAVDSRMQPLAESPTIDTIQRMLSGRRNYPGSTPEIRLSEPPGQEGTYQAEIYANPHEAGTLLLYIKDSETGKTLRLLNCPVRYSDNQDELFRHDIPGSVPQWARDLRSELNTIFPPRTPLFVICTGRTHRYFGAAFEVWFRPADPEKPQRLILRRCYKVQPYEIPEVEESTVTATDITTPPGNNETPAAEEMLQEHATVNAAEDSAANPDISDMKDDATDGEETAPETVSETSCAPAHQSVTDEHRPSRQKGYGTRLLEFVKSHFRTQN